MTGETKQVSPGKEFKTRERLFGLEKVESGDEKRVEGVKGSERTTSGPLWARIEKNTE